MTEVRVEKRGFKMNLGKEWLLIHSGFPQKGYWEEIPLSEDDIASHARAKAALEELENNPWVMHGYEPDELRPLEPRRKFTPEETQDEWMARWEEAGCPDFESNILPAVMSSLRKGPHRD